MFLLMFFHKNCPGYVLLPGRGVSVLVHTRMDSLFEQFSLLRGSGKCQVHNQIKDPCQDENQENEFDEKFWVTIHQEDKYESNGNRNDGIA